MKLIQVNPKNSVMIKKYIQLPYSIYKDNPYWVPPLSNPLKKLLIKGSGMQLRGGPYALFMVEKNNSYVARLLVGVNKKKNKEQNQNQGYFSLFECINDINVARFLMNGALDWLKVHKVDSITGPVSPTNGDDFRGVLIEGFEEVPAINTSYTMGYYKDLLESLDFEKHLDFYAFSIDFDEMDDSRVKKLVEYGKKKINLSLLPFNKKKAKRDIKEVYEIFIEAMQTYWDHLEIPTYRQFYEEFITMKSLLDPDLIYIARVDQKPVGFVAGLPDYNQVLYHLKGKRNLFSILKFLYYKRKISRVRMFMQFVVPKYQKSVVTPSLYLSLYEGFLKKGYKTMEASTIAEFNIDSLQSIKGVGFHPSRIYRIYEKKL